MAKSITLFLFIFLALALLFGWSTYNKKMKSVKVVPEENRKDSLSIHNLSAERLNSDEVESLGDYSGKVMLVVNTASKCGLTPQFAELQALYDSLKNEDFVILGFPSNDFLNQDPGSEEEIAEFCQMNYGVDFPMFEKVKVKGPEMHPVYQFLTEKSKNGVLDSEVSWNFQKYLLDKQGHLVAMFQPKVSVTDSTVQSAIAQELAK